MAIIQEHNWRYIFHFTSIHNLDSIIKNGLLCTNVKEKQNIIHENIANMNIQNRRSKMEVTCGKGGVVHDYVPFYFTSKNPMFLGVLNKKNIDQPFIIYLCVKISRLDNDDAVFTDASANTNIPPHFYSDTANLDKLNWSLIDSLKWSYTDEERHKKMAEALIYNRVGIEEIDAIVVYNNWIADEVRKIFERNSGTFPKILLTKNFANGRYKFYYTKYFFEDRKYETLVTGPLFLKNGLRDLLAQIKQERDKAERFYKYNNVSDLLYAISENFCVLPELASIYELGTGNYIHRTTVAQHTKHVVDNVQQTEFYKNAIQEDKNILLLAAYLHDIGKGPSSKWKDKIQYTYPDHPYDAIPGLHRILTEEIATISDNNIRRLCLLVVYHDIVGDCLFIGRERQQIVDVIEEEKDIDMLIELGLADVKSLNSTWYSQMFYCKNGFKKDIMHKKGL